MRLCSRALTCFLLAALASPALAGPETRAERRSAKAQKQAARAKQKQARQFTKRYQIADAQLARNVERLQSELRWHDDLSEARATAIEAGKPILWIHALGDLSGLL